MTDKAIMMGDYVDLKFLPGLKSARVFVDIPIEHSNVFLKMFDAPDRINPVKVVIARVQLPTAEPLAVAAQAAPIPNTSDKPRTPFRDMPRSQQAALKLQDDEFVLWLDNKNGNRMGIDTHTPDRLLKTVLGITSKRQLDFPDSTHGAKWDALLTDFDNRQHIR